VTQTRRLVTHLPRPTSHLVSRPRLLRRLDARTPLTVLRAPLGFGKTTLVAQWLTGLGDAPEIVAWVRVRPGASDATVVWSDILDVLADAGLPVEQPEPRVPHLQPGRPKT
jgi:LuxR family maltose regulon positive regulatory protein